MLLIGNIRTDGRVQKEIGSLKGAGHGVTLGQWAHAGERGGHAHLGIEVVDYPPSLSRSPLINFIRQILFNFFAFGHLRRLRPDYVQCNDLNTLIAGWLFRRRARIVFDAHELFPESQGGCRRPVWEWLERLLVPGCHVCIQPEKNRLAYFAKKRGIPAERIVLLENFPRGNAASSGNERLRERFGFSAEDRILL